MIDISSPNSVAPSVVPDTRQRQLTETAEQFESAFLAEMLRHAGVSRSRDAFGGGAGEEAFSGYLADAYARQLVDSGGIGLAEHIFHALARADDAAR